MAEEIYGPPYDPEAEKKKRLYEYLMENLKTIPPPVSNPNKPGSTGLNLRYGEPANLPPVDSTGKPSILQQMLSNITERDRQGGMKTVDYGNYSAPQGMYTDPLTQIKALGDKVIQQATPGTGLASPENRQAISDTLKPGFGATTEEQMAGAEQAAGVEPWQKAAQVQGDQEIRQRGDRLSFLKSMAQSADLMGRGMAGLGGSLPPEGYAPASMEGINEQIGLSDDKMTSQEVAMAKSVFGIDLPQGYSFKRFATMMPSAAGILRTQSMMGLGQQRLDIQNFNAHKLPNTPASRIEYAANSLKSIDRVRQSFNADQIGPVEGRVSRLLINLGVAEPGVALTNANLVDMMAKYVRSISGVAVSEKEFVRLRQVGPNIAQNADQFNALIDNFERIIKSEIESTLKVHEDIGYDVNNLRKDFGTSGNAGTANIRVRVKTTGATGTIPANEFDESIYEKI